MIQLLSTNRDLVRDLKASFGVNWEKRVGWAFYQELYCIATIADNKTSIFLNNYPSLIGTEYISGLSAKLLQYISNENFAGNYSNPYESAGVNITRKNDSFTASYINQFYISWCSATGVENPIPLVTSSTYPSQLIVTYQLIKRWFSSFTYEMFEIGPTEVIDDYLGNATITASWGRGIIDGSVITVAEWAFNALVLMGATITNYTQTTFSSSTGLWGQYDIGQSSVQINVLVPYIVTLFYGLKAPAELNSSFTSDNIFMVNGVEPSPEAVIKSVTPNSYNTPNKGGTAFSR